MTRVAGFGEGGDSPVPFDFEALQRTVAFLSTPHLLAVMTTVAEGRSPYTALPGVLPEQIDDVVQRLLEVGVARLVVDDDRMAADAGAARCPVALTPKGRRVLQLVLDLREPVELVSGRADGEYAVLPSEQLTD
jgi:hypothetical protein